MTKGERVFWRAVAVCALITISTVKPASSVDLVSLNCPSDGSKAVCLARLAAEHPQKRDCDALYVMLLHLGEFGGKIRGCEHVLNRLEQRTDFRLLGAVSHFRRGDVGAARAQLNQIGQELRTGQKSGFGFCFPVAAAILDHPLHPEQDHPEMVALSRVYRSLVVLGEGRPEAAKRILERVSFQREPGFLASSWFFALGVIGAKLIERGKVAETLDWLKSAPLNWRSHGQIIIALLDHGYRDEARALAARYLREGPDLFFRSPWAKYFRPYEADVLIAGAFVRSGEHLAAAQIVAGARAFRGRATPTPVLMKSTSFSAARLQRFFDQTEGINADWALVRLATIYSAEGKFAEALSLAKDREHLKRWLHEGADPDKPPFTGDAFFLIYALYETGQTGLIDYAFSKWHKSVFRNRVNYFNRTRRLPANFTPDDPYDRLFVEALDYYHDVLSGRGNGVPHTELLEILFELENAKGRTSNEQNDYRRTKAIIYQTVGIAARKGMEISVPDFFLGDLLFYLHAGQTAAGLRDGRHKPCDTTHYIWGYYAAPEFRSVESFFTPGAMNRYLSCCGNWLAGTLVTFYEGR